ncbi:MAG: HEAT repeat domain-containing protein [Acidimicrobiia bacterium]|nr:HEAT repeat domain-containing protein [Acidimicrobiia bacterium]
MTADLARASAVVEALSAAWTVYNLYPDPASQSAFVRVADTLRQAIGDRDLSMEVGPTGFLIDGEEIQVARGAAERLVKQCFVHNMEVLAFSGLPSDADIVTFLSVLSKDEEDLRGEGGIGAILAKEGISNPAVVTRSLLSSFGEPVETVERDVGVQAVMSQGSNPEEFARSLLEEAGGDRDLLGTIFHDRYRDVFSRVDEKDVSGREMVVTAFVDAFFYFDEGSQVAVLGGFLTGQEDQVDRVFLDQFAGNELAILAPQLDSRGFSLLLDYARIATDQIDKRPEELLGLLESPEPVRSARELVATRVQERLADLEGQMPQRQASASLRTQFPDPAKYFYETLDTFRGLLAVEERDDRFRRLMRVLTGKISGSIRRGRYRRAELWLRAAVDHPTYAAERAAEVRDAISQAGAPDVLEGLIAKLADDDQTEAPKRLLSILAPDHIDVLIDMMAAEEDRARRRTLLDVLGRESARDPRHVIRRLDDERWFVVRNLVIVLGRSGNTTCVPAVRRLLAHHDHRVRVEALRSLSSLDSGSMGYFGEALSDSNESVRQAAIAMLGARGTGESDSLLIGALWSAHLDTDEKERIIRVLGERPSNDAQQAIESMARKRFTLSAKVRQLRSAAREALEAHR